MAILGVQMFTLRKYTQAEQDLDECFRRIRDIGYTSIQVSAFGPEVKPETTAEVAAKHGLAIGGTHVPWPRFLNDLDAVIAEHKLWDCRHTAIGMIPPADYLSLAGMQRFQQELEPVAAKLHDNGMTFSYHNHAHEFLHFDGKPWLAHLLDETPPEQLKWNWIPIGSSLAVVIPLSGSIAAVTGCRFCT